MSLLINYISDLLESTSEGYNHDVFLKYKIELTNADAYEICPEKYIYISDMEQSNIRFIYQMIVRITERIMNIQNSIFMVGRLSQYAEFFSVEKELISALVTIVQGYFDSHNISAGAVQRYSEIMGKFSVTVNQFSIQKNLVSWQKHTEEIARNLNQIDESNKRILTRLTKLDTGMTKRKVKRGVI
ncbi:hypothetical protein [Spirochaeta isovalerica]|uniref:NADH:ubiquinone oxidoreductase subunit D n=1 Tax=Spirochaeta isovalerica TaxID=150 RepID=A0A841RGM4_9SPIO|nr:hypothetical protein [Spirochaeta isovalerica]MBB6482170.1 NADH:ubiquinone oxidoreductase subunit D [Spirochaeta isovalerica]